MDQFIINKKVKEVNMNIHIILPLFYSPPVKLKFLV